MCPDMHVMCNSEHMSGVADRFNGLFYMGTSVESSKRTRDKFGGIGRRGACVSVWRLHGSWA